MNPTGIRILLIDDEESEFLMTRALLGRIEEPPMELEWAPSFEEGLARLGEHRHDLCLLDYHLGEETGVDLLQAARSRGVRTPLILLTGKGSREVDLGAMKAGAVDYLQKGMTDPAPIERAIRYAVERHRAQEELRASEERHRGMFDHLPLGLFRVSAEGEYMEANPALIRILEFPDREAIGRIARDFFVSPEDRDAFFRTLADEGMVVGFESRLRTATGRPIRVRSSARVHRSAAGQIEYIEGTVEDVSGRVPPEELEAEAEAFRTLLRTGPARFALLDLEGRVRTASASLGELLGHTASQVVEEPAWDLFHPDDSAEVARDVVEVAEGRTEESERLVQLLDPAGDVVSCRATILPVLDHAGSRTGLLLFLDVRDGAGPA